MLYKNGTSIKYIIPIATILILAQPPAIFTLGMLNTLVHITGSKLKVAVIYFLLSYSKIIWR